MIDSCNSLQLAREFMKLPAMQMTLWSLAPTDVNKSSTLDGMALGLYSSNSSPFRMLHTVKHRQFQQKNENNQN